MAVNISWNNFILVENGDSIRSFAQKHDYFIYPYDIQNGSDIAMFESIKAKSHKERFIICSTDDMRQKKGDKENKIYEIVTWSRMGDWNNYCSDSYEGAITLWNDRMKKAAEDMLKPPLRRFIDTECTSIFLNLFLWGLIFFITALNNDVFHFYSNHPIFTFSVYMIICSNIKNIFLKSYGDEIPEETLRTWANAYTYGYDERFCSEAMNQWSELREHHENSVPLYLLWKRGKLRRSEDSKDISTTYTPNASEDMTCKLYCSEIRDSLHSQINEINDQRTKISDKIIKGYIENILKILKEIEQFISSTNGNSKIMAARRVVSYWNEETISLLKNYIQLLNNSSDEAGKTKSSIEDVLKDMHLVYKKELGRITETNTMKINASISVIKEEIDQVLNRHH